MTPFNKHAGQRSVDAPLNAKFNEIKTRLNKLQAGTEVGGEGATLGDDAPLPANRRAAIAREEAVVRQALKAVGYDYDALIAQEAQEGKTSAYAQAVAANPAVLKQVLAADSPVVAALEVAMSYQPYAEFNAKYGREPEAIRQAIRAEVMAEMPNEPETPKPNKALPFSRMGRALPASGSAGSRNTDLAAVFKK